MDNQLETWGSVDHSKGPKSANNTEDSEDAEELRSFSNTHSDESVNQRDDDKASIHSVPSRVEVRVFSIHQTLSNSLKMEIIKRVFLECKSAPNLLAGVILLNYSSLEYCCVF